MRFSTQVRGTVRSTKNEQKVAPLKNLVPNAKYPLELVEGDLSDEKPWLDAVKGLKLFFLFQDVNLSQQGPPFFRKKSRKSRSQCNMPITCAIF